MAFVMSHERVAEVRGLLEPARFTVLGTSVRFHTTRKFVASVLPPGFEPAAEPTGLIRLGTMQSAVCGEFDLCTVVLQARFREWEGQYCLAMLISGDMPVTVGRDFWGHPKKNATSYLHVDGDRIFAFGSRDGVRLAELEAVVGEDLGPVTSEAYTLELKAWMSPDGGLQAPPCVFVHRLTTRLDWVREGPADLTLRSSRFDPLGEIPIERLEPARYYSGESSYNAVTTVELADGDRYLPYIYGRAFDDLTLFRQPARYRVADPVVSNAAE